MLEQFKLAKTVQEVVIMARTQERPAPTTEDPAPTENEGSADEPMWPEPIDPPDNASLPGDPSVTRPDY
jgi:hypothetical protein